MTVAIDFKTRLKYISGGYFRGDSLPNRPGRYEIFHGMEALKEVIKE